MLKYHAKVNRNNSWWGGGSMPRMTTQGQVLLKRGQDRYVAYHYAYHTGKRKWINNCQSNAAWLTAYNRRYGSAYRHRSGSRYKVRKKCWIKHSRGTTYLYPGDWVAIDHKQGFVNASNYNKMRVDGYYKKGRFYELNGGWLSFPLNTHPNNYVINTK